MTTPKSAAELLREAHARCWRVKCDAQCRPLHSALDAAVEAARREGFVPQEHFAYLEQAAFRRGARTACRLIRENFKRQTDKLVELVSVDALEDALKVVEAIEGKHADPAPHQKEPADDPR